MTPATVLLAALALVAATFAVGWGIRLRRLRRDGALGWGIVIGAVTNFFDTLGIGSFAPTTAAFRALSLVSDRIIPGTLNVGHALPSVAQALVFIAIVEVEPWTLASMIVAAVAGAWLGAGVVAGWDRRRVQIGMGLALLAAAALMLRQQVAGTPAGAEAVSLAGVWLALGLAGNFVLGALMMVGVGLYAPCMILVTLLGMNAKAAFPVMMGSCAFLMPVAGWRFVVRDAYAPAVAFGLTVGGIPAVLVAAFVVRALPLEAVRTLVLCVTVYTALTMLLAARRRAER
ncbi:MAG TPA: permease [Candidatus Limnocylindria bacterium]|nr:permease [Candidatus Limnocylindria bacterium]